MGWTHWARTRSSLPKRSELERRFNGEACTTTAVIETAATSGLVKALHEITFPDLRFTVAIGIPVFALERIGIAVSNEFESLAAAIVRRHDKARRIRVATEQGLKFLALPIGPVQVRACAQARSHGACSRAGTRRMLVCRRHYCQADCGQKTNDEEFWRTKGHARGYRAIIRTVRVRGMPEL